MVETAGFVSYNKDVEVEVMGYEELYEG